MKTTCEIGTPTINIVLPEEWFGDSSQDYERQHRYSPGHIWAGQVERTDYENHDVDAMYEALSKLENSGLSSMVAPGTNCYFEITTDLPVAVIEATVNATLEMLAGRRKKKSTARKKGHHTAMIPAEKLKGPAGIDEALGYAVEG